MSPTTCHPRPYIQTASSSIQRSTSPLPLHIIPSLQFPIWKVEAIRETTKELSVEGLSSLSLSPSLTPFVLSLGIFCFQKVHCDFFIFFFAFQFVFYVLMICFFGFDPPFSLLCINVLFFVFLFTMDVFCGLGNYGGMINFVRGWCYR